jgi:peptidoglycan/xylan/chitin deacetylase (PgdA/CDA1 family)
MIPVLLYRFVSDAAVPRDRPWTVRTPAFAAHLRLVAASGRVPMTVSAFAAGRRDGTLPDAPVLLTFDGGSASIRDAVRRAADLGIPATVHLPTGRFDRPGMLSRDDVEALRDAGAEIGANGHTYCRLDELTAAGQRAEVRRCRADLTDILGAPPRTFAYPHGSYDSVTRAVVQESGFVAACAAGEALLRPADDLLAIPRFTVSAATTRDALWAWLTDEAYDQPAGARLRAGAARAARAADRARSMIRRPARRARPAAPATPTGPLALPPPAGPDPAIPSPAGPRPGIPRPAGPEPGTARPAKARYDNRPMTTIHLPEQGTDLPEITSLPVRVPHSSGHAPARPDAPDTPSQRGGNTTRPTRTSGGAVAEG